MFKIHTFISSFTLCALFACAEPLNIDKLKQVCLPNDPQCASEDFDGDNVINGKDDFPSDSRCAERDNNNCSACGVSCGDAERCSDEGACVSRSQEVCDGVDNDGDGEIDEEVGSDAPVATNQEGVCSGSRQVCDRGEWIKPPLSAIEGYEPKESACDGVDSDCDGQVDEELEAPLSDRQIGACAGSLKRCLGSEGWSEPVYAELDGYEFEESACDGRDNDCDGEVDEAESLNLTAPLAQNQWGVCLWSKQICDFGSWQEPRRDMINGFEAIDLSCDEVDSDCDGIVDEDGKEICNDGVDNDCDLMVDETLCSSICGDSFVDSQINEECDDGNTASGDGCDSACLIEVCGNGRVEGNESCDDSNTLIDDCPYGVRSCSVCGPECIEVPGRVSGFCGDQVIQASETCDDGNDVTEECMYGVCEICDNLCNLRSINSGLYCGDGIINGEEQCDGQYWCSDDCDSAPPPCTSAVGGCPDLDFVWIEGGTFMMGDEQSGPNSNSTPIHMVNVPSFHIMRKEITVAQYNSCVDAGGCSQGGSYFGACTSNSPGTYPINCVSWRQIMDFATWIGARLPTEAEWEFAASSRGQYIYPWGDVSPSCMRANYGRNQCGRGILPTSECSLPTGNTEQDICYMAGNLQEYVVDEWHDNYDNAPNDGSGWCNGACPLNSNEPSYSNDVQRVLKGSSYEGSSSFLRASSRNSVYPSYQHKHVGGRLCY